MKNILKLLALLAFIMPFGIATADTHDDATMDVISHSDATEYDHDIHVPDDADDDKDHAKDAAHDADEDKMDDDKDESHEEKEDSDDDMDSATETENEIEHKNDK